MSNEFINKEIDEIMKSSDFDFPQNTAMSSAWILGNLKGTNLKVLKMSEDFPLPTFLSLALHKPLFNLKPRPMKSAFNLEDITLKSDPKRAIKL